MGKTKIPWVEYSINPVRVKGGKVWKYGYHCTKISPGCAHCYAEPMNMRFGTGQPYDNRKVEFYLDLSVFDDLGQNPCMVFVQSMGDIFHEDIEWNSIYKVFERILLTDQHTYIILTKRSKRMRKIMPQIWFHLGRNYPDKIFPLKNVIGMVTVEDQKWADERILDLLKSPFAIRGLSIEPMLGPVSLTWKIIYPSQRLSSDIRQESPPKGLDWVIVGAESGAKRRECKIGWVRDIVDQCQTADVPVFVKQIHIDGAVCKISSLWPRDIQVRQYPKIGLLNENA